MQLSFHSTHVGEKFVKKSRNKKCIKSVIGNNIQSFQYKNHDLYSLSLASFHKRKLKEPHITGLLHKLLVFQCHLLRSEWDTVRHAKETSHSRAGSWTAFLIESLYKLFFGNLKVRSMRSSCSMFVSSVFHLLIY